MLLLLAVLAAAPDPRPALELQCRTQASDPKNPWALAHGLLAFGPTFRARDGRLASEVIVHDFARADGSGRGTFPQFAGRIPVQPHPNLLTATLVESGLPLETRFPLGKGTVTLSELVQDAELSFDQASLEPDWPSAAWTLLLLADVHSPRVAALEPLALRHLEQQQAFLGEAMDRGEPSVAKAHQGIWSEPCGGVHFVEAVMAGARSPEVRRPLALRLARQQAIFFYRLEAEHAVYTQALTQASPEQVVLVLAQELKFYGHWLEAVGRMQHDGVLALSGSQQAAVARGRELLAEAVFQLDQRRAFADTDAFRSRQPQLALDLTGDACHAVRGLDLTR